MRRMVARRVGYQHPSAVIGEPAQDRGYIGAGIEPTINPTATLEALCQVDAGTTRSTYIGEHTWLMKLVHVGHDAWVGDQCELAPGVILCGWVVLWGGNRLGVGAVVLPYKHVGLGARIGAGAVVTKNVPPGEVWAGNPARRLPSSPVYEGDEWTLEASAIS